MPVNLAPMGALTPIDGIAIGVGATEEKGDRPNLAVFRMTDVGAVGGVFTPNGFRAPPVRLAERRMGRTRALVVNSGNANAATGERGMRDAEATCARVAAALGVQAEEVAPFSTGVIGEFLNMAAIARGVDGATANLGRHDWADVARAIMTTDTVPKGASAVFEAGGATVHATGVVKGSGMIAPRMATMLAFLGTDAAISAAVAADLAGDLAARGFNRVSVDGDTSTNDAFVVMATGASGAAPVATRQSAEYAELLDALTPLAIDLAQRVARDGEGVTKFVTLVVEGPETAICHEVARSIAQSPLVRTALFASDPNWGRVCMAIGNSAGFAVPGATSLRFDDVLVMADGAPSPTYSEAAAAQVMAQDEFTMRVTIGQPATSETYWISDLSEEYVRINAAYRT